MLVIAAAILWSTGGAAIKLTQLDAAQIAGGRALPAAIVMFLVVKEARHRWDIEVFKTSIAYALTCGLFVLANTLTTAGNAIFIQNLAPVWVLVVSPWLLDERPTRPEKISVVVALTGCALFFADDLDGGRISGNLAALLASFSYAALLIRYRKTTKAQSMASVVMGNLLIVAGCAPFMFAGPTPTFADIAVVGYLGIVQQALAAVLFIKGVQVLSGVESALLVLLEPIFSPVWAFLLVGERLGPLPLLGAALVLASTAGRIVGARSAGTGAQGRKAA